MKLRTMTAWALRTPTVALMLWSGAALAAPPEATPIETAPSDAAPSDAAPSDAAPSDAAPSDAAPTVVVPMDAVPIAAEPVDTDPTEPAAVDGTPARVRPPILRSPIDLSGYFWVDSGYMLRDNARASDADQDANYMQGRFVLAAEYNQEIGGFFAKAKTEFIGFVNEFTKSQFEAHVLDAYAQFGQDLWDVQVGRFLAWEVYHRGLGIELYTAEEAGALGGPGLYWLAATRGHKDESGQLAFHLYPTDFLSVEIAGVYGQESNQNNFGLRPVVDLHVAGLQLIAGFEYLAQRPQKDVDKVEVTTQGFAAKLQYHLAFLTAGVDFAMGSVEHTDIQGLSDSEKTLDKTSLGGFINLDFLNNILGFGFHHTTQENKQGEVNTHQQLFVAYQYRLPIDGLSLKAVYGYALASIEDLDVNASWENSMHSVRLRVAYDFQ